LFTRDFHILGPQCIFSSPLVNSCPVSLSSPFFVFSLLGVNYFTLLETSFFLAGHFLICLVHARPLGNLVVPYRSGSLCGDLETRLPITSSRLFRPLRFSSHLFDVLKVALLNENLTFYLQPCQIDRCRFGFALFPFFAFVPAGFIRSFHFRQIVFGRSSCRPYNSDLFFRIC